MKQDLNPRQRELMTESEKYRIKVEATAEFVADSRLPKTDRYVFAYHIRITNVGTVAAQLIAVTGSSPTAPARRRKSGAGRDREQPTLAPGQQFTYSSGSVIETPVGTMHGTYEMAADDGHRFEAEIPAFMLAMPRVLH